MFKLRNRTRRPFASNGRDVVGAVERPTALRYASAGAAIAACCAIAMIFSSAGVAAAAPAGCEATDLYVNPVHGNKAAVSTAAECTFASITKAIESAQERGLGAGARIILTGATSTDPAEFEHEKFPLVVPAGVTITTSDDPALGGAGLNPASYVVQFAGRAPHALEVGGGLKGVTLRNERAREATAMVICGSGSAAIDAVTLDGANTRGSAIAEGLRLQPACDLDADALRVRGFGGDGVIVERGADLTLDASKVHNNGGDGVVIRGLSSISGSEIAFNGDDGVLVDSSDGSAFEGDNVRDNGGNGFEIRTSSVSFLANRIHNNSRSTGWTQAQMLFVGPAPTGVQLWTGTGFVTAYAVGVPNEECDEPEAFSGVNQIYSYDTGTDPVGASEESVGLYAKVDVATGLGAAVWADNNSWRTAVETQNVDQDASSIADADVICPAGGLLLFADPNPGPPVE